jgi:CBS domain-containing protein
MKIEYLYQPDVVRCSPSDTLAHAAHLLVRAGIGALAVVDDGGTLVGVLSERDLARAMTEQLEPGSALTRSYASQAVEVAERHEDSWTVGRRMLDAGIRHLPVVSDGQLVGMVSMRDVLAVETWA